MPPPRIVNPFVLQLAWAAARPVDYATADCLPQVGCSHKQRDPLVPLVTGCSQWLQFRSYGLQPTKAATAPELLLPIPTASAALECLISTAATSLHTQ